MTHATATIRFASGLDVYSLTDWLNRTDRFRGCADVCARPPGIGEMGSSADVVTVTVGSRGVLALLVGTLYDWVVLQRDAGSLTLKITRPDGTSLEVEVDRVQDRAKLIGYARRLLEPDDDGGA